MRSLSRKEMVEAVRASDARYDGRFFLGVTSTGIYCVPSCRARVPLEKNMTFFPTRDAAVAEGFRGCRRCRSEFWPDTAPRWLEPVVTRLTTETDVRIDERELARFAGVDISTIRRYFRHYLKTTPMAYHRRHRLARARKRIEAGADYLTAAYECGFESASGFRDAFVREFGRPPGEYYAK